MDRKGGPSRKQGAVARLLDFAGPRKTLTYVGCALSAIDAGGFRAVRLHLARGARPHRGRAELERGDEHRRVRLVGARLLGRVHPPVLRRAHVHAPGGVPLRVEHAQTEPPSTSCARRSGYFDTHASGALRRVVDGCAAETEGLLAHKLPDTAGSVAMIVGMLVLFFAFDWRLGLACLAPVVLSICCMINMMGGRGMDFMTKYMESLVKMNKTGTEYVRGIPVVKVFQQTVYSFKAFHDAIQDFTRLAQDYAVKWCRSRSRSRSPSSTAWRRSSCRGHPARARRGRISGSFLANFAFYAIFSAVIPTAMTRVMFMSEAVPIGSRRHDPRRGGAGGSRDRGAREPPGARRATPSRSTT